VIIESDRVFTCSQSFFSRTQKEKPTRPTSRTDWDLRSSQTHPLRKMEKDWLFSPKKDLEKNYLKK
jgi:hypothetical protein